MKNRGSCSGHILLEATLIIPIIITIAFAGIEFTRSMRHAKIAMSLSREAANLVFRECSDRFSLNNTQCLRSKQLELDGFAESLVPGAEVIVTVYITQETKPGTSIALPELRARQPQQPSANSNPQFVTRLNAPPTFLSDEHTVVIAEAYVPYSPLISGISGFFRFNPQLGAFYDATTI